MASLLTSIHSRELDSVMWTFNMHLAWAILKCMCMCVYILVVVNIYHVYVCM